MNALRSRSSSSTRREARCSPVSAVSSRAAIEPESARSWSRSPSSGKPLALAAEERAQLVGEGGVEPPLQEPVGARGERDVVLLARVPDRDERHVRERLLLPEPGGELGALDVGQVDVREHQVGGQRERARDALEPGAGQVHREALPLEQRLHALAEPLVSLDAEHAARHGDAPPRL